MYPKILMPISQLTIAIAIWIKTLFPTTHTISVLASHTKIVQTIPTKNTSTTNSTISAVPTLSVTPTTTYDLVDCIGPDQKHLRITQKACIEFNQAWNNAQYIIPTSPYGQATKIGDHSYIINVKTDNRMATPQEIIDALNRYRLLKGSPLVATDEKLTMFAQQRANFYLAQNKLDQHAGFIDFVTNQNGYQKLGFNNLGENASLIGPLLADHLIQWVFASDTEHDSNQLKQTWTNVGVGVNGRAVDIIFGAQKR